MNNNKQNPIVVGVAFIIAGPLSAFCGAAVLGIGLGWSFTVCFYSIWGVLSALGAFSVIGGIMQVIEKRKSITS